VSRPVYRLRQLAHDKRGISVTEFALIAPVFLTLLLGTFDMMHGLYMQSVLQGAIQKTARDLTLESGTQTVNQTALDDAMKAKVKNLAKNATVDITRKYYKSFTAAQKVKEPFTDTNGNGVCDGGNPMTTADDEPYEDTNNNGVWDVDQGTDGQGGAQDTVVYTVSVSYPRMFSFKYIGLPATTQIQASTVLANQPYGDQSAPTVRKCTS
jgi:Flp pilus assembly protein TadG